MLCQIFYLTSSSITAYHYDGRALTRMAGFVAADAGLADFDPYLEHFGHLPTYVLADMVEEDFRVDSVAHTLGRDRNALLERHATRVYRGTEYRHAQVLGRDPQNKRKDNVLFSGLLNPESADLWLDAMRHYRVPVAGIYSLPLLSTELMKKVWDKRKDVLLVTHNAASGLRQSYFSAGQLRFSRLTPVPEQLPVDEYAEFIHAEIGKTKRYLSNLHLLGRDVVLDVCMLSGGARLERLEQMREIETLTHYHLIPLQHIAARLRYRTAGGNADSDYLCDGLYAFMAACNRARNHYASPERRFHYRMLRARQALSGICVAAGVAGLLWAGTQVVDALLYHREIAKTEAVLSSAETRYGEIQARLPQTDFAPDDMRLAVAAATQLQQQRHVPHTLLAQVGQALQMQPSLQIEQIDWFVSGDRNATVTTLAADETALEATPEYDENGNPLGGTDGTTAYQIGIVQGRVLPFAGDFSRAHQQIEALLSGLRMTRGVLAAEALQLPLNTATSGRVLGSIGDETSAQEAPFTLRLVLGDERV